VLFRLACVSVANIVMQTQNTTMRIRDAFNGQTAGNGEW